MKARPCLVFALMYILYTVNVYPYSNRLESILKYTYVVLGGGLQYQGVQWDTTSISSITGTPRGSRTTFPNAKFNSTNGTFNVLLGHDWQVDPTIFLGVEGEFVLVSHSDALTNIPGAFRTRPVPLAPGTPNTNSRVSSKTQVDVRGRFGANIKNYRTFGIVGAAFLQHANNFAQCNNDGINCNLVITNTISKNLRGIIFGAGIERRLFKQYLFHFEYDYTQYKALVFNAFEQTTNAIGYNSSSNFKNSTFWFGIGRYFI